MVLLLIACVTVISSGGTTAPGAAPSVCLWWSAPFRSRFCTATTASAVPRRFASGRGFCSQAYALAKVVHARSVAALGKPAAASANLLVVEAGRPGIVAQLRSGERAGDPVRFVVTGPAFARSLARDPGLVRYRFEALEWNSS